MKLKVIKADHSTEEYMHTKVIGAFSNALAATGEPNVFAAEQFAEAVTYHLYNRGSSGSVTTDEIHLMIQSVLTATGYEIAARAIRDHRISRDMKRRRLEIVDYSGGDVPAQSSRWDKARIVGHLVKRQHLNRNLARAIASCVEEKVFNLGMYRIPKSLVEQLVIAETQTMLDASLKLQMVTA